MLTKIPDSDPFAPTDLGAVELGSSRLLRGDISHCNLVSWNFNRFLPVIVIRILIHEGAILRTLLTI